VQYERMQTNLLNLYNTYMRILLSNVYFRNKKNLSVS